MADERFNADNFGHQPQSLIFGCLKALEAEKRNEINAYSITNAQGFSGVFGAFGGGKVKAVDLLPYQDNRTEKRLSDKTRQIAKRLKMLNKVPANIWGTAWASYPELSDG